MPVHNKNGWTLFATSLGIFIVQMDVSVVNIALNSIQRAYATNLEGLQWVVSVYTLFFAALLLTAGSITDRIGAKWAFICGLGLFTLMSLACGTAHSIDILIISRALQGAGAALIMPSSLSLLHTLYIDHKSRSGAIGIWAGAGSLALATGPVLGGLLVIAAGWRSIFYINIPLGILGIWVTYLYAPESRRGSLRNFDLLGQITAILAIGSISFAITRAGSSGLDDHAAIECFLLGIVSGTSFLIIEQKTSQAMLPLVQFQSVAFSVSSIAGGVVNFAFYGMFFLLSLFFQSVKSYSALSAGMAFFPVTVVIMTTNVLSGKLSAHVGVRRVALMGLTLATLGYGLLAGVHATTSYLSLAPRLIIAGIGTALTVPAFTIVSLSSAQGETSGIISGIFNGARQIGGLLGVTILGSIAGNAVGTMFVRGIRIAAMVAAAALLFALILSGVFIRDSPRSEAEVEVKEAALG